MKAKEYHAALDKLIRDEGINPHCVTMKDLARVMSCHPRTVKRWWKRLGVFPDFRYGGRGALHFWTAARAKILLRKWSNYFATHRHAAGWRNGKKYPA